MTEKLKAVLVGGPSISPIWLDAIAAIPELALVGLVNLEAECPNVLPSPSESEAEVGASDVLVSADLALTLEKTQPDVVSVSYTHLRAHET